MADVARIGHERRDVPPREEDDDGDDAASDAISSPMRLGHYIPGPGMFPRVAKLEYHTARVSLLPSPSLCEKVPERGDEIDSRSKTLGKHAFRCIQMQYCGYHRRQIPDRWLITTSNREIRIGDIGIESAAKLYLVQYSY